MTAYRYIFADLLTNVPIGELPLTGVTFGQTLNGAGAFQGHLLLGGVNSSALNVLAATTPSKCALFVDRDGVIVWGGKVNKRQMKSSDGRVSFVANEFEDYFSTRLITSTAIYTATDQLAIARALIVNAQAVTNGNIGVQVGSETSGILIAQSYYGYAKQNVLSELLNLANAAQGFDFNITCSYDSSRNIIKTLHLGYPRIGRPYTVGDTTNIVLEHGVNIIDYEYTEDGSTSATSVYVTGAGSNEAKLVANSQRSDLLTAGWALQEKVVNYGAISNTALLGTLASGLSQTLGYPPAVFKINIPANVDPIYGTYAIGDDVRVRIKDEFFPAGLDAIYRLVATNVTAGETQGEKVTLTLSIKTV